MTVDAGRAALLKRCVRRTAGIARRMNCRRIVAFAASDTVIAAHLVMNLERKFGPPLLPHRRVVEVMGVFGDDVPQTR